ncbi:alpha-glucan family phosphorylase [candidate division CSSED10-310 bacterium]|uniref:Alpha-glucan family phosphorylase n=1 Tax=candidate division CSSED10-310 bacterium TaxID=2855610 RepID=A0ABV6YVL4_UNCC1
MPKFASFTVIPSIPERLAPLEELAKNIMWSWHHSIIELFRRLDRDLWDEVDHNPVRLLGVVSQERFDQLTQNDSFLNHLDRVVEMYNSYMYGPTWFQKNFAEAYPDMRIAYFSMEYGLTECLRIYSGGLGVLSGDHLKSASDLGLPLVGVGLLYQEGYFQQYLNADGWQQETYPQNDFYTFPVTQILDEDGESLKIDVHILDRTVYARIWKIQVGRIPLFMLDTNIPENNREDQDITDKLYGGDTEMRIKQEIMLGIGGTRALHAMGIKPTVCHMNEGHSAFQVLERNRLSMFNEGVSYKVAAQANGGGNVFTTHTPVPAGFDIFHPDQIYRYFQDYANELGISVDFILRLGRGPGDQSNSGLNMAILAATNSPLINGVSKLHSKTSRKIFRKAFGTIPEDEIFITPITNGVHYRSWISLEMEQLFDRYLGSRWREQPEDQSIWERVYKIPDEELWRTHERRRERLIAMTRNALYKQLMKRGSSQHDLDIAGEVLSPDALTIGFARRFATYKRANLFLLVTDRIMKLLSNKNQPIQFIFAGKAHPHDDAGKEFIRQIVHFARDQNIRRQIVFLEDYNISLARYLVQGVDVWLNTPQRPLEASGTSGMKVVPNGGLNLSTLDGWWDEGYDRDVGWSIGSGEEYTDKSYQDRVESGALYNLLEYEIIPRFYNRGQDGLPRQWISMMKHSIARLGPVFNTHRMVMEYFERFYLKAHQRITFLIEDNFKNAIELGDWKHAVKDNWDSLEILNVIAENTDNIRVGEKLQIRAEIDFGNLDPEDINVEVYYGSLDSNNDILGGATMPMNLVSKVSQNVGVYEIHLPCTISGRIGYIVRVIPDTARTTVKHEMLLIKWADMAD